MISCHVVFMLICPLGCPRARDTEITEQPLSHVETQADALLLCRQSAVQGMAQEQQAPSGHTIVLHIVAVGEIQLGVPRDPRLLEMPRGLYHEIFGTVTADPENSRDHAVVMHVQILISTYIIEIDPAVQETQSRSIDPEHVEIHGHEIPEEIPDHAEFRQFQYLILGIHRAVACAVKRGLAVLGHQIPAQFTDLGGDEIRTITIQDRGGKQLIDTVLIGHA